MGADYLELANTQYYGWAWHNREQLLPSREQVARARGGDRALPRRSMGDRMRVFFVVPDYFERRPKPCMNGLGSMFLTVTPDGTALPCHAAQDAARPRLPEREGCEHRVDLARLARLQPLPRRQLDEGALPQLPRESQGLRRLPLPGLF